MKDKYLSEDSKDSLRVIMPVVSEDMIGLDNKCKSDK